MYWQKKGGMCLIFLTVRLLPKVTLAKALTTAIQEIYIQFSSNSDTCLGFSLFTTTGLTFGEVSCGSSA